MYRQFGLVMTQTAATTSNAVDTMQTATTHSDSLVPKLKPDHWWIIGNSWVSFSASHLHIYAKYSNNSQPTIATTNLS